MYESIMTFLKHMKMSFDSIEHKIEAKYEDEMILELFKSNIKSESFQF